jgi:hypothetical protein
LRARVPEAADDIEERPVAHERRWLAGLRGDEQIQ